METLKTTHLHSVKQSSNMKMQFEAKNKQESQLSPMGLRDASCQLKSCHATVQKLLVRQVLNQVSAVTN